MSPSKRANKAPAAAAVRWWAPPLAALQFLTRVPVRFRRAPDRAELGRSTGWFPLAGLLLLGLDWLALKDPWQDHEAAWMFLLLLFWTWFAGSLHLDGLADTADGLASGLRGRPMLKVMHQGSTGAFGVMALMLSLLGKWTFLACLPNQWCWFLPLPLLFSRLGMSLACGLRPYAGEPGSLSGAFILQSRRADRIKASALALLGFGALAFWAWHTHQVPGLKVWMALLVCLTGTALGLVATLVPLRRLGGVSGDLIGFGHEVAEVSTALGLVFLLAR